MKIPYTEKLISELRARMREPLPGWEAQKSMAAETYRAARLPPPSAQRAGVLILLYPGENHELYFPLIQRPRYEGAHSGQIAFPGGKVEPQDESIIHTALRETKEEIGVEVATTQVLGKLSDLYIPVSRIIVSPVVAYSTRKSLYQPDPTEVASTLDVSVQSFLEPDNRVIQDIQIPDRMLQAPAYRIQKRIIWGATAMMLAEFFWVLKQAKCKIS